jgi:hypothetical protein
MATVRWCREAVQLTRVVRYLSCFDVHRDRQEPSGHASRSKMVWTLKKPKPYGLRDDPVVIAAIDLVRWELSLGA